MLFYSVYSVKPDNLPVELDVFDFLQLFVRPHLVYDFALFWLQLSGRLGTILLDPGVNTWPSRLLRTAVPYWRRSAWPIPKDSGIWFHGVFLMHRSLLDPRFHFPLLLSDKKSTGVEESQWHQISVFGSLKKWPCRLRHGLFDVQRTSTQFLQCTGYFLCTHLTLQHPSQIGMVIPS